MCLASRLRHNPVAELTLVDQHDYHQVITEFPRVADGTRDAGAVRIPLEGLLADQVRFVSDAERVWAAVSKTLDAAASAAARIPLLPLPVPAGVSGER